MQVKALSGATQDSIKRQTGLPEALQQEVIERCGIDEVDFVDLDQANRKTMMTIAALALATYFLFPQFADLPGIVDQVREANWTWTPLIILASSMRPQPSPGRSHPGFPSVRCSWRASGRRSPAS